MADDYLALERAYTALEKDPARRYQSVAAFADDIERYLAGKSDALPLDITRGGALRQLAHRPSLLAQVKNQRIQQRLIVFYY